MNPARVGHPVAEAYRDAERDPRLATRQSPASIPASSSGHRSVPWSLPTGCPRSALLPSPPLLVALPLTRVLCQWSQTDCVYPTAPRRSSPGPSTTVPARTPSWDTTPSRDLPSYNSCTRGLEGRLLGVMHSFTYWRSERRCLGGPPALSATYLTLPLAEGGVAAATTPPVTPVAAAARAHPRAPLVASLSTP